MALADYVVERKAVPFKGGSFDVRGLSLDDVTVLMREHLSDLDQIFELYASTTSQEVLVGETARYAIKLVQEAPGLVANVIALASDEPHQADRARTLSIPVQVDALEKIFLLTFEEAGGAKKFFESLGRLLTGLRPTVSLTSSPN